MTPQEKWHIVATSLKSRTGRAAIMIADVHDACLRGRR